MARYRRATPSNVKASRAIQDAILQRIVALSATATAALESAADPEIDVVTRRGHLATARTAEKQIDDAVIELAAAAVLGGGHAADVARRSGISTATLTRRMPPYMRALRGEHLVEDADAPYGWKLTGSVSRGSDQAFCDGPAHCDLNSSASRSGSRSASR